MLTNQYGFSANAVTVTQVVANLGAMTGGTVIGYLSQMFGRRFSIIFASIVGGALIYPYGFIGSERVIAPAFFEQAMVQGVRTISVNHNHVTCANNIAVCPGSRFGYAFVFRWNNTSTSIMSRVC